MGVTNYATLDGEIVSVSIDGVRKDLIPDPLGSIAALVDSTGTITDTFTYWPYGEERTRTGTTEISTRFVGAWGYYWDNPKREYVRARYLEKNQTRWLTVDPLWPSEAAYGYVGANPAVLVDSSGQSPVTLIGPGTCIDLAAAERMVQAAYATGGTCAAQRTASALSRACPYLAVALAGWMAGRFIDEQCGISDKIVKCLWPDELYPDPGTIRNPQECSADELRNRQQQVASSCKDKHGNRLFFGCKRFKGKRYDACVRELLKCINARLAVCECFFGGCNESHLQEIETLNGQYYGY